ncbi:MAG TPA: hypothetical protein O0X69_05985 [Methanocorpusculum sp.]|nr:hypothetical protein [Methanocorpusculum sp.]
MYFDFVYGICADTREKPTANRRKSALRARKIGFADPHSRSLGLVVDFVANPLDPTARPFIGIVRANPVGAPAPPVRKILFYFVFI